jgi:hypothetical protein
LSPAGQPTRAAHSPQEVNSSGTQDSQKKDIDGTDTNSANGAMGFLDPSHQADFSLGDRETLQQRNAERLLYILTEPSLRSLFREFLKSNFCEENLSFWLDVQDFKKKFSTISSSNSAAALQHIEPRPQTMVAIEHHRATLITTAFTIYKTYIAPSGPCELSFDHALSMRNELAVYLTDIVKGLIGQSLKGYPDLNARQLQQMIQFYERIQAHVFRLMATDSVPKVSSSCLHLNHVQCSYSSSVCQNDQLQSAARYGRGYQYG